MKKKNEYSVKLILLGEMAIGKTSLINAYLDEHKFNPDQLTTSEPNLSYKSLKINKTKLNIVFWDTMGQERFRSVTKNIIKDSNIVILVYDITNRASFLELNYWLNVAREVIQDEAIFGLVGNKIDLFNNCEIERQEAEEYASKIGAQFTETSAKENPIGFRNFVNQLLEKLVSNQKILNNLNEKEKMKKNIQLEGKDLTIKKKKCC